MFLWTKMVTSWRMFLLIFLENEPTVGFIAHYDTSPDFNGKRQIHKFKDYNGGDLVLNQKQVSRFRLKNS